MSTDDEDEIEDEVEDEAETEASNGLKWYEYLQMILIISVVVSVLYFGPLAIWDGAAGFVVHRFGEEFTRSILSILVIVLFVLALFIGIFMPSPGISSGGDDKDKKSSSFSVDEELKKYGSSGSYNKGPDGTADSAWGTRDSYGSSDYGGSDSSGSSYGGSSDFGGGGDGGGD